MADNTTINAGTGGDVIRDKDRAGVKTQIVGLDINAGGSEVLGTGDATNGLDVDVTRVQGTVTTNNPDTVSGPTAVAALNAAVSVAMSGTGGAGMFLAAGTLIGTIIAEVSMDGGTTYVTSAFFDPATWTMDQTIVFASSNGATTRMLVVPPGASHARVRVSAFTSGTANLTMRATLNDSAAFQRPIAANTGTQTSVASTVTTNTTILAANDDRKGAAIYNESTASLFLLLGSATESATVYTLQVPPNSYYEVPFNYTGIIKGHWSAANGSARITEMS